MTRCGKPVLPSSGALDGVGCSFYDKSQELNAHLDMVFRVPLEEEPLRLQSDTGFSHRLAR